MENSGLSNHFDETTTVDSPQSLEKHLGDLQFFSDGKLVLSTSNLTGRYWTGSLWCFKTAGSIDPASALAGVRVPHGIGCLSVFGNSQRIFLGLDDGSVSLLSFVENSDWKFRNLSTASEHDDVVSTLDSNTGNNRLVSGSADRMIKMWDTETLISTSTYRDAHSDSVTDLAFNPQDNNLFASCSLNGEVTLWDSRLARPAKDLSVTKEHGLANCLAWSQEGNLALGTENGHFMIQDLKNVSSPSAFVQTGSRRIRKIKAHRDTFALCGDDSQVVAVKLSSSGDCAISYKDDRHNDFVRGLAWHPITSHLYSTGWDKQLLCHEIDL